MNFIRIAAVSLGAAIALITSATIQAQTTPTPTPDTSRDEVEISGIATRQMQDQVRALVAAYLGLWSIEVPSHSGLDFVAENAVFEYPYADDAYRRIEGREAIESALREFPRIRAQLDLQRSEVVPDDLSRHVLRRIHGAGLRPIDSTHL